MQKLFSVSAVYGIVASLAICESRVRVSGLMLIFYAAKVVGRVVLQYMCPHYVFNYNSKYMKQTNYIFTKFINTLEIAIYLDICYIVFSML